MAQHIDLVLDQGSDFACLFVCVDGLGNNIDFADYSARMQLKNSPYGRVLDELSTENGRLEFDFEKGAILAKFPNEVTATLPASKLIFDVVLQNDSGFVFRPIEGTVRVKKGVTT